MDDCGLLRTRRRTRRRVRRPGLESFVREEQCARTTLKLTVQSWGEERGDDSRWRSGGFSACIAGAGSGADVRFDTPGFYGEQGLGCELPEGDTTEERWPRKAVDLAGCQNACAADDNCLGVIFRDGLDSNDSEEPATTYSGTMQMCQLVGMQSYNDRGCYAPVATSGSEAPSTFYKKKAGPTWLDVQGH